MPPPVAIGPESLTIGEIFWRDHQKWLEESGYMLRARYLPGWKPSWLTNKVAYFTCDDGLIPKSAAFMDATHVADGEQVMLKLIKPSMHPHEEDIATYLSSEPLRSDPKNHCVPIYEVLRVPDVDDKIIIVMPLLRPYDRPPFKTIGESIDYFQQVFEGLQFMHKHHVAHRDCSGERIMLDGSMFLDGWHPCRDYMKRDFSDNAKCYSRTEKPPKYYFVGFGISRRYNQDDHSPKEIPIIGEDKSVPEFKSAEVCDPYPTDVYYLGNMIRKDFIEKSGLGFMKDLVDDMVQDDPTKRPTMDQVVQRFCQIRGGLKNWKLRARLSDGHGMMSPSAMKGAIDRVRYSLHGIPPVPCR